MSSSSRPRGFTADRLALSVRGISKTYTITKADLRPGRWRARRAKEAFHALTDVSFDVQQGEAVGIIGRNGAGKSTLLKILSRVVEPTAGRAELYGRVGSLLEIGTGFHPELTGRENVYLNGAVLGMTKREITRQFDSIVEFAQVERFLDTPVKRYSSGMYVRLAFAVAAHLNPEILIIDEVLAVGDVQFQKKCLGKMDSVARDEGRTVLFVSHNMTSVSAICKRSLHLDEGRIVFDGPTHDAIERYVSGATGAQQEGAGVFDLTTAERRRSNAAPILMKLEVRSRDGQLVDAIPMGAGLSLAVEVEGLSITNQAVVVRILTEGDVAVVNESTTTRPLEVFDPVSPVRRVLLDIPSLPLVPGHYWIDLFVQEGGYGRPKTIADHVEKAGGFDVLAVDVEGSGYKANAGRWAGIIFLDPRWEVEGEGTLVAASHQRAKP